jgi:hypothetical protein
MKRAGRGRAGFLSYRLANPLEPRAPPTRGDPTTPEVDFMSLVGQPEPAWSATV